MNYAEHVLGFACDGDGLVGVLAVPETPAQTAVVIVVGGPQYRAGSHRQFVLLARHLAAAGYAALRFDVRGMGDSRGSARGFEAISEDIGAAIDAVQQRLPGVTRVVLWGLCDGASAALLYCHDTADTRVRGLCLANPWVRSATSLARTHVKHYYTERLRQRAFWIKLWRGKVAFTAVKDLLRNLRAAAAPSDRAGALTPERLPYPQRMAAAWRDFDGELLLLLSGRDYTAKEFSEYTSTDAAWAAALRHPRLQSRHLHEADHTFSAEAARSQVDALTIEWLERSIETHRPAMPREINAEPLKEGPS